MALIRNMKTEASRQRWVRIEEAAKKTPNWVEPNITHLVEVLHQENQAKNSPEVNKPSKKK